MIHSLDSYHMISIVEEYLNDIIFTVHDCFIIHPNINKITDKYDIHYDD
jgi:hypothetical protein